MPQDRWRDREGFKLTDPGMDLTGALDQAHYCIKCHNQAKDSCSTGLKEKTGEFKKSVFGVTLAGCPLDEKISEMNVVKQNGNTVGALADRHHRQSHGRRHRPSHLQRLHEGLHLSRSRTRWTSRRSKPRTLKDVLDLPVGLRDL